MTRGSTAVMASRREPPNSLDFFPTPPWATRALLRHVLPMALGGWHIASAWDPACGEGHMAEVLAEDIALVRGSDVFDYGRGYAVADFLDPATRMTPPVDLIATNPPFNVAVEFAERALEQAGAVALLLRTAWIEGEERYQRLFRDRPETLFAPFVERVPMLRGRWDPTASTATAYAWFVWVRGAAPLPVFRIPPGCRRTLTKPTDAPRFAQAAEIPLFVPSVE
ncbi:hypothetical protein [Methylobacterium dankookense]|uniref:Methyltransferase n=1 Tax=Methylobacterium dankookense TaxID=560405 RepID=A0A564G4W5_9HYPH|nr:hypothetical protein [Methylobacterium dankookense]GJD58133.1 hypothetical protein IFDJLNFL_4048 [Methylobacterium dankookense]VUF15084.1 hypothetical protein MTDSW087_04817 [Methylobacterium dankookense]